jgi:hypothetical protein
VAEAVLNHPRVVAFVANDDGGTAVWLSAREVMWRVRLAFPVVC